MENCGNFHEECVTRENFMSKNSLRGQNGKSPRRAAGGVFQTDRSPPTRTKLKDPQGVSHTACGTSGGFLAARAQLKLLSWNGAKLLKYLRQEYLHPGTLISFL